MGKQIIDWELDFGSGEPSYVSQDEAVAWFGEGSFIDAVQGVNNDVRVCPLSKEAADYSKRFGGG